MRIEAQNESVLLSNEERPAAVVSRDNLNRTVESRSERFEYHCAVNRRGYGGEEKQNTGQSRNARHMQSTVHSRSAIASCL